MIVSYSSRFTGAANIKCGDNEFFSTCKSSCYTDSCNRKDLFLREYICDGPCDGSGCVCEQDCARNKAGNCVKRADCDKDGRNDCGPNEVFEACQSSCLAESCADSVSSASPAPPRKGGACKTPCRQATCQCKPNHFRSIYAFNQCVPSNQCPKNISNSNGNGDSNSNGNSGSGPPPIAGFDGGAAGFDGGAAGAAGAAPSDAAPGDTPPPSLRRRKRRYEGGSK